MPEQTVHDVRRAAAELDARRERQVANQRDSIGRLLLDNRAEPEIARLNEELAVAQQKLATLRAAVLNAVTNHVAAPAEAARLVKVAVEESEQ